MIETFVSNLTSLLNRLNWSDAASTALVCPDTDSYSEPLYLPWHEENLLQSQVVQHPNTIDTSKWTNLVMGKACKAFGINAVGFEHEILDLILRMDQNRQAQIQKRGPSATTNKKGKLRCKI